jgi:sugar phosphate isomerase/epimerase
MNRALSTHIICNHRLTTTWLNRVEAAGISTLEIFCAKQHLNYRDKSHVTDLGHWFRDSTLTLRSFHAPMYTDEIWGRSGPDTHINITCKAKADRMRWVEELKRVIEVAETIPFRYLIQHMGVSHQEFSDHAIDSAFTSLEELIVFARQRGVEILLENIPNELSTAERLNFFNNITHLNLNYVFDTGHAHIGGGIEHEFEIMKPRVRSLHVHDNDGKEDQHLVPLLGAGTVDWVRTMELLRSRPDQYPLMLELKEVAEMQNPIGEIVRVFDELEALEPANA